MRKCFIIIVSLAALVLSATATAAAGNGSICRDGAQTGNGSAFSSMRECQKATEVFRPSLTIEPSHVVAGERFTLTANGFHPDASVVVLFAITGQAPYGYVSPSTRTLADGSWSLPFVFEACGNSPDHLTLTLVDSFGVHASATMTLC